MKLTTTRSLIRTVAARWEAQYRHNLSDKLDGGNSAREILAKLRALDTSRATAGDVEAIVGNDTWTMQRCNQCGQRSDVLVEVGEEPDYESRTADLCLSCVRAALALLESSQ